MLNSTGEVSTRIEVVNSVRHTMPAIYQVTYTCHSHGATDFPTIPTVSYPWCFWDCLGGEAMTLLVPMPRSRAPWKWDVKSPIQAARMAATA